MSDSVEGDFTAPGSPAAPFHTVGILGLGLIGGSLAMAIRARHPGVTIVGVDRPDVLREARQQGLIDRAAADVVALGMRELAETDLLVLAAPVLQNLACLEQLVAAASFDAELGRGGLGGYGGGSGRGEHMSPSAPSGSSAPASAPSASGPAGFGPAGFGASASGASPRSGRDDGPAIRPLVTDVGSTKRVLVDAARVRPGAMTFVGGHPMAGAAQGGLAHARADLFEGKPWLLTPDGDPRAEQDVARLIAFFRSLGAEPRVLPAAEHDRLMAYVSHLPQMMSSALMRTVGERVGADALQLSGPGLADTTRLASSPAAVWTDICETNADLIDAALDAVQAEIAEARQHLRKPADLAAWLAEGARWRTRMPPRAV